MWAVITAGFTLIGAVVFGLARASSHGEQITENHREELLARKNSKSENVMHDHKSED